MEHCPFRIKAGKIYPGAEPGSWIAWQIDEKFDTFRSRKIRVKDKWICFIETGKWSWKSIAAKKYREKLSASYMAARSWHCWQLWKGYQCRCGQGMNGICLIPRMKMERGWDFDFYNRWKLILGSNDVLPYDCISGRISGDLLIGDPHCVSSVRLIQIWSLQ